jgi:hypothetical protein
VLLRGSGEHADVELTLAGIMPTASKATGVAHEALLNEFADAFYADNETRLEAARQAIVSAQGARALIDAAGIIGMFDAVVRVADATGIPLEPAKAETSAGFRKALGIDEFHPDK